MAVKKVAVPELGTLHLYKRRGVRGLRLSVGHAGEIRVSLPTWLPYKAAVEFALSKKDWLKSRQTAPEPLKHGDRIGKAHRLVFIPEAGRQTPATRLAALGEVRIYAPDHLETSHHSIQKAAQSASIRALKQQANTLLPQRLQTLAEKHQFAYGTVKIKHLTSRWGSCSDQKDIALSCFLMQLPWHLIDYVLLHELMHTRIMAHGTPFWNELEMYVPNLKQLRKEIKNHRPVLRVQSI